MLKNGILAACLIALMNSTPVWAMSSGSGSSTAAGLPDFAAGKKAVEAKDYAAAEKHLMASVKKLPNHVDSLNLLGYSSRKLGKVDAAFKYYRQALSIDDAHRPSLNYLGHLFLETGQMDKAKGVLDQLNSACHFGCDEYDDLKAAVAAGKSGKY